MLKTAIVHDWLIALGGAEKCLKSIYSIYPSDLYTLTAKDESIKALGIEPNKVFQSFIKNFPLANKIYRSYLPFFPFAIEQFDLSEYDLVISSSHAVAKNVLTHANQLHICYCYTPMRYAWDLYFQYLKETNLMKGFKGFLAKTILHYLRIWDNTSASRVDHFIAISQYIAKRIKKIYGRDSTVIYPPVDIEAFQLNPKKEDFYLVVSRLVPYKKVDLIVEAFSCFPEKKLVVIGDGPDLKKIKKIATKNVDFLGEQPFEAVKDYLQKAKALIFATREDFGIVPVEAQACGTPVIAFGEGGALETVIDRETGIFFKEQKVDSVVEAIKKIEISNTLASPARIRKNAERFSKEIFEINFKRFVDDKLQDL